MDETRYQRIEERLAWLEKHVLEQDKVMLGMGDELKRAKKALQSMQERVRNAGESGEGLEANERPPHY